MLLLSQQVQRIVGDRDTLAGLHVAQVPDDELRQLLEVDGPGLFAILGLELVVFPPVVLLSRSLTWTRNS